MRIPAAKPQIGEEERAAVDRVLRTGQLAQGVEVAALEDEFSKLAVDGRHCVAVNSGTSALHLALLALGIGPGDEVIVPSFTFAATANAVALTGATPVFADIDPVSFCLSPESVAARIRAATRAIVPVHLYGHPADMRRLSALASDRNLLIVEDAAQAHLAKMDGREAGTWGDAAAFSFYPTKNMTSGEGGMVSTADPQVAGRVRLLRNQGQELRYQNEIVGFNNRMTDIHAAIGRVQLRKLDSWTVKRQSNARYLTDNLQGVKTPHVGGGCSHVFHQYTVRVPNGLRDALARDLAEHGIGSGVYYPTPVHRLPAYGSDEDLVETEGAAREVLSLPVYPSLSDEELAAVAQAVNDFMARSS